ncbi:hypothetical protein AVEN_157072-1 [Araneus ventricosus]|uniref:Uncharacterized protein n=1 Tax=Araneus ventricosus TaxID=182803 RepID=A0A4Y2GLS3_ARAVE|nr:hypothetical protein AVEN_157072-1 [Araneus ventricosus]
MKIISIAIDIQHFSTHQPRSELIFPQFLQPKEWQSNTRLAMCFCFGTFNGTCTKGVTLEVEDALELDHILEKHGEIRLRAGVKMGYAYFYGKQEEFVVSTCVRNYSVPTKKLSTKADKTISYHICTSGNTSSPNDRGK